MVSRSESARLSHLIVIAPVFGLETVDRNQLLVVGWLWSGCISHFPVS